MSYVSHARTAEQLKAEVCSDLHRRIELLNGQLGTVAKSEEAKSRVNRAIIELSDMLRYWTQLEIIRNKK